MEMKSSVFAAIFKHNIVLKNKEVYTYPDNRYFNFSDRNDDSFYLLIPVLHRMLKFQLR